MKKCLASTLALMIAGTPVASAQNTVSMEETFDSIFAAFITPADGPYAKWEAINGMKGVSWAWPLNQISQHNYSMKGSIGDYIDIEIHESGYYDPGETLGLGYMGSASISITTGPFNPKYITIERYLENGKLTKISTNCDEDGLLYRVAFYEWAEPDKHRFYIHYEESSGSRMGNVDYTLSYVPDDLLYKVSPPAYTCKPLK